MSIEILNYKPNEKGYKIGSCDIKMLNWGNFIIYGISIFDKAGQKFISFPSYKYTKEGEEKWMSHCRFESKEMAETFRKHFFIALDKYLKQANPSALDTAFDVPKPVKSRDEIMMELKVHQDEITQKLSNQKHIQGKAKVEEEEPLPF